MDSTGEGLALCSHLGLPREETVPDGGVSIGEEQVNLDVEGDCG